MKDNIMNGILYNKCSGNKTSVEKKMCNRYIASECISLSLQGKYVNYNDAFLKEGGLNQ